MPHTRARRHRQDRRCGRGWEAVEAEGGTSARWSTTPAVRRRTNGVAADGGPAAAVQGRRCSARSDDPAPCCPGMRAAGCRRIVDVELDGRKLGVPGGGAYHASKCAVEAISDALRFKVKGLGDRRHRDPAGRDPDRVRRAPSLSSCRRARAGKRGVQRRRRPAPPRRPTRRASRAARRQATGAAPKAVEKAITAQRAPIRTRIQTASAHVLVTQQQLLPDRRARTRSWATQFKRPGLLADSHEACRRPRKGGTRCRPGGNDNTRRPH